MPIYLKLAIAGSSKFSFLTLLADYIFSLGKTIQVVAFLSGLFDMDQIKTVLIVLPVAVIVNWQREFQKW